MNNPATVLTLACLLLGPTVSAQPTWTQQSNTGLPALDGSFSVYDPSRHRVILFGGQSRTHTSSATYEHDGTTWILRRTATSPRPRAQFSMVYDLLRGRTVLFGGAYFGDTWEYDGQDWTEIKPVHSPGARCCAAMAYMPGQLAAILFGGYGFSTGMHSDTWSFDGTDWVQLRPTNSPSPRCCTGIAYDSIRNRIVLFGGGSGAITGDLGDTWEFDGSNWQQMQPQNSPPPRRGCAMAFDALRGRTVLFGGGTTNIGSPAFNDTWEWDGVDWRQVATAAPPARFLHSMVFDPSIGGVIVLGGNTGGGTSGQILGDRWTLADAALRGTPTTLSLTIGGQQVFTINAGAAHAGRSYALLGSTGGTWPGIMVGGLRLPLNLDPYLNSLLASPNSLIQGQIGMLDGSGRAQARLVLPAGLPQSLVGLKLHHAYGVVTAATVHAVSEAVPLRLTR